MKNKKFKLTFLGAALCFALVGCSNDDSVDGTNNNNSESRVVSNENITITYGKDLLMNYSESNNSRINLINGYSARSGNPLPTYQNQTITGATNLDVISNPSNVNTQAGTVYYIPTGSTFNGAINLVTGAKLIIQGTHTGALNFNGGEIYVEGALNTSSNVNVPSNSKLFVGPDATFGSNTKIHLNEGSYLENYGVLEYKSSSVNGEIKNYKTITFKVVPNSNLNINGFAKIINYCKVIFENHVGVNGIFENHSYAEFKDGFYMNTNAKFKVEDNTYTKVGNGTISINSGTKVENPVNSQSNGTSPEQIARLDLASGVTATNMNATVAFDGLIDINTSLTKSNLKAADEVQLNLNTYIEQDGCIPVTVGDAGCDSASVNLNYAGIFGSPVIGNVTLSATDVRVNGNYAYVSYHTNDELFGQIPYGSIRIFNISDPQAPELISQADFNKAEFNSLEINGTTLYAVGNDKSGAIMYSVPLVNDQFSDNLSQIKSNVLPSLSAKNINFNGSNIWLASSGTNGGLMKLNADFTLATQTESVPDAKYVRSYLSNQVFLALQNGSPYLKINDQSVKTYPINLNVTDGKNTLALESDYVYAALSDAGVAKFNLLNGDLVERFIPSELRGSNGSKVLKKNGYSNAVAVDLTGCFLYVANGGDGVVVLNKKTMKYVGHFALVDQRSANYVYSTTSHLFVASGRNGLAIISKN